ncbi:Glycosyltransferase involved in cell wall bisynthesis [bacterium A37T11]|nr:Glycosyltransferase involved in cell wall bisynthesis [bacterium A37T11]
MAKICLVSNTSWSFVRFRADLLQALISDGHQVILLAPEDEYTPQLSAMKLRFIILQHLYGQGVNPLADQRLYREFRTIYQLEKPELVIQYTIKPNIYSTLAASRLHIPAIAVITGLGYTFINKNIISLIASRLYRYALKKANRIWFLNQDDLDLFLLRRLVPPGKTLVLPGEGINCKRVFNPALFPQSLSPASETIRFLLVGRLLYDKGIREYIMAARQIKEKHPQVSFYLLGYLNVQNPAAVPADQLEEWVQEGIVSYLGVTDDVRPYLLGTDCVVLPSYREGMSTILQESAAMEKPIIASDIAGCKELITHGKNGYLCKPRNPESLVQQMEAIINLSYDERRQMGKYGREKMMKEFSVDKVIQIYKNAIKEITKQY